MKTVGHVHDLRVQRFETFSKSRPRNCKIFDQTVIMSTLSFFKSKPAQSLIKNLNSNFYPSQTKSNYIRAKKIRLSLSAFIYYRTFTII